MDLSSTASPSSTQTPPNGAIKKAIFKKPSWLANRQPSASLAKNETNSDNTKTSDAVDIFSRSNDTHAAILAEREQKERKAREKKESKTVKREKSGIREDAPDNERETKRLRLSTDEEDHPRNEGRRSLSAAQSHSPQSSSSLTQRYNAAASHPITRPTRNEPVIIDLGDSDSEGGLPIKLNSLEHDVSMVLEQDQTGRETLRPEDDPDEEFPELAAKARERAREQERLQSTQSAPGPDPVIVILIHSDIPNTGPLLVKRRYRQTFRDVRRAWCSKNELSESDQNNVFFTFRGRRVFDVATPKSLGIRLDYDGSPVLKGEDGYSEPGDKIDFIATTVAILEQQKKDSELEAKVQAKKEQEEMADETAPENQEKQYRVIMRSKGRADHKVLVRESTDVRKMAGVFRRQYKIEPDKRIMIVFDGEELSPDTLVKDTEIIDLDPGGHALLEVYIK